MNRNYILGLFLFSVSICIGQTKHNPYSDTVTCDSAIMIQRVFCPTCKNGSPKVFLPKFISRKPYKYELTIYDTTGYVVFFSEDYTKPWDGMVKDKNYMGGDEIYEWSIEVIFEKDETYYSCNGVFELKK